MQRIELFLKFAAELLVILQALQLGQQCVELFGERVVVLLVLFEVLQADLVSAFRMGGAEVWLVIV